MRIKDKGRRRMRRRSWTIDGCVGEMSMCRRHSTGNIESMGESIEGGHRV